MTILKVTNQLLLTLKDENQQITRENIRNTILKKCIPDIFKITFILTILNHFKPKRWLDLSAGWGDRLIGACI